MAVDSGKLWLMTPYLHIVQIIPNVLVFGFDVSRLVLLTD